MDGDNVAHHGAANRATVVETVAESVAETVAPTMAETTAEPVTVAVQVLPHGHGLALPAYATPQSAGVDLTAAVTAPLRLAPGARALIPTGLAIALPSGYEAQVRPRSGLALKDGVTVLNSPGTVDADYRGEIGVVLINHGQAAVTIDRGMRIAQLVVAPVARVHFEQRPALDETSRGHGGFGSTGVGQRR